MIARHKGFLLPNIGQMFPTPRLVIFTRSTIRLFKAVPIEDASKVASAALQASILSETLPSGFIIAPQVIANHAADEIKEIIKIAREEIGLSGAQMNSAFHKSWNKVKDAPICQLVLEQLVHYVTTYGFERLGVYSKESVYIPKEELDVPGLDEGFPVVVIKGCTRDEIAGKLMAILSSGIALKEDTVKDIVNVAIFLDFGDGELSAVKNKEVRVMLYDYLDKVPSNPVEFLRFVVYKATNTTLLIKNDKLINAIKGSNPNASRAFAAYGGSNYRAPLARDVRTKDNLSGSTGNLQIVKYFKKYDDEIGFKKLSAIFNRFKPLFLAFKTNDALKHYVNQIAKLSKTHHVPMPEDYLNDVTASIRKGIPIVPSELQANLEKANIFRKVRLAYALKFRMEAPTSIMYKVRNGTAFATAFSFQETTKAGPVLDIVLDSIARDLKVVEGKTIYIPGNIVYALPATEKQFTGDIPSGSCVSMKSNIIAGIHWKNLVSKRVDLDLSLINATTKIGWDGIYRATGAGIFFSGDMTDAPGDGASEMFYINKDTFGNYLLSVNHFNYGGEIVPFFVFVGESTPLHELPRNFMIDPNAITCKAHSSMDRNQKILGLISIVPGRVKFYFSETHVGNFRTMTVNDYTLHAFNYLSSFYTNPISLNDLLQKAGATIISNKEKQKDCDLDMSPGGISKETFVNLLVDPAVLFPSKHQ